MLPLHSTSGCLGWALSVLGLYVTLLLYSALHSALDTNRIDGTLPASWSTMKILGNM